MTVSSLWMLKGCSASLQWATEKVPEAISSRVDPFPPSTGPWPRAVTLQSYTTRNDSGKEHWTTVTCTFYSLSNEAPHEVGTVFTPVRAPEGVHLEDRSRKENYRRWPNHFTDISINACKQCTTPLLWRYHMQCLEVSLYHEEKN